MGNVSVTDRQVRGCTVSAGLENQSPDQPFILIYKRKLTMSTALEWG
jgi:hypothetical protein